MNAHYVVDTSVLIQGVIDDSDSARVDTLLTSLDENALHVPEFGFIECANVLWKRVRFANMAEEHVKHELQTLLVLPFHVHASPPLLPRALEIGLAQGLAVYDCVHIALAERLNCPLITVDVRQANAAQTARVPLKPIPDFPEYTSD